LELLLLLRKLCNDSEIAPQVTIEANDGAHEYQHHKHSEGEHVEKHVNRVWSHAIARAIWFGVHELGCGRGLVVVLCLIDAVSCYNAAY